VPEVRTTSSTGGEKGVKLERFDLIPTGPLAELAAHYGRGARKYANHQWRQGYEWSKSYSAMLRHQNAFWAGFDYDVCSNDPDGCQYVDNDGEPYEIIEPDTCFNHTGSHHMAAVAWHAFLLLEFKDTYPEHDDRYKPPAPEPEVGWYQAPADGFNEPIAKDWVWTTPDDPKFGVFPEVDLQPYLDVIRQHVGDVVVQWADPKPMSLTEIADRMTVMAYTGCWPQVFIAGMPGDNVTEQVNDALNRRD
jgi:hypothetical protein